MDPKLAGNASDSRRVTRSPCLPVPTPCRWIGGSDEFRYRMDSYQAGIIAVDRYGWNNAFIGVTPKHQ